MGTVRNDRARAISGICRVFESGLYWHSTERMALRIVSVRFLPLFLCRGGTNLVVAFHPSGRSFRAPHPLFSLPRSLPPFRPKLWRFFQRSRPFPAQPTSSAPRIPTSVYARADDLQREVFTKSHQVLDRTRVHRTPCLDLLEEI